MPKLLGKGTPRMGKTPMPSGKRKNHAQRQYTGRAIYESGYIGIRKPRNLGKNYALTSPTKKEPTITTSPRSARPPNGYTSTPTP